MPGWLNPMRKPIIISQWEMYILQRYLAKEADLVLKSQ